MKNGVYKKCLKCSKTFYVFPYLVKSLNCPKYCSFECRKKGEFRNCMLCKKTFYATPSQIKNKQGKYCSQHCSSKSRDSISNLGKLAVKGRTPPLTAFKSRKWTFGGTVSEYKYLHYWINKEMGKPKSCVKCNSKIYVEWANKSHEYKKDSEDWIALCKKCHFHFDNMTERMRL